MGADQSREDFQSFKAARDPLTGEICTEYTTNGGKQSYCISKTSMGELSEVCQDYNVNGGKVSLCYKKNNSNGAYTPSQPQRRPELLPNDGRTGIPTLPAPPRRTPVISSQDATTPVLPEDPLLPMPVVTPCGKVIHPQKNSIVIIYPPSNGQILPDQRIPEEIPRNASEQRIPSNMIRVGYNDELFSPTELRTNLSEVPPGLTPAISRQDVDVLNRRL